MEKIKKWKKALIFFLTPVLGVGFLRLLLALSVVFAHSAQIPLFGFISGSMAVQSFFIVSGFYMALILTEKYKDYRSFITNRFLRIFPLYFAVCAVIIITSLAFHFFFNNNLQLDFYFKNWQSTNSLTLLFLILSNIFIFGQEIKFFVNSAAFSQGFIILQSWTLSLELMFYLLAPFLVRQKNKVIFLLMGASFALRIFTYYKFGMVMPWTYNFFPNELFFFLAGIISYRIYEKLKEAALNKKALAIATAILFLYVAFYNYIPSPPHTFFKNGLYFLILIADLPLLFILSKKSAIDRYIGELSYPIYLSHIFLLQVLALFIKIPEKIFGATISIISIIVSILLYHFIVKPIDSFRHRRILL